MQKEKHESIPTSLRVNALNSAYMSGKMRRLAVLKKHERKAVEGERRKEEGGREITLLVFSFITSSSCLVITFKSSAFGIQIYSS